MIFKYLLSTQWLTDMRIDKMIDGLTSAETNVMIDDLIDSPNESRKKDCKEKREMRSEMGEAATQKGGSWIIRVMCEEVELFYSLLYI